MRIRTGSPLQLTGALGHEAVRPRVRGLEEAAGSWPPRLSRRPPSFLMSEALLPRRAQRCNELRDLVAVTRVAAGDPLLDPLLDLLIHRKDLDQLGPVREQLLDLIDVDGSHFPPPFPASWWSRCSTERLLPAHSRSRRCGQIGLRRPWARQRATKDRMSEDLSVNPWADVARVGMGPGGTVSLVEGSTFLISDARGDVLPGGAQGLFHRDTRFLSRRPPAPRRGSACRPARSCSRKTSRTSPQSSCGGWRGPPGPSLAPAFQVGPLLTPPHGRRSRRI